MVFRLVASFGAATGILLNHIPLDCPRTKVRIIFNEEYHEHYSLLLAGL